MFSITLNYIHKRKQLLLTLGFNTLIHWSMWNLYQFSEGTMGALNKYCMRQYWRSSYCISPTPYNMCEDSFYCHFWVSTVKFFTPKWIENIRITIVYWINDGTTGTLYNNFCMNIMWSIHTTFDSWIALLLSNRHFLPCTLAVSAHIAYQLNSQSPHSYSAVFLELSLWCNYSYWIYWRAQLCR